MLKETLLFVLASGLSITQAPLPNWVDTQREVVVPLAPNYREAVAAPPTNFRVPAEYEPAQTVLLSFAGFESLLEGIARAAVQKGNVS
ncbi:hypothetical protein HDU91_004221, partial [Kappamyces sp. JEL0680]